LESDPSPIAEGAATGVPAVSPVTKRYEFDPAGNRKFTEVDGQTTTYEYNAASQLVAETGTISVSHAYDTWGNEESRTSNGVTETYQYNHLNLLSVYTKPGATTQYEYWPTGERYSKSTGSNLELYVPRHGDVGAEYSDASTLKNLYVQGTGVDQKQIRIDAAGQRRHYLGDQVGTVSVTLTDTGAVAESSLRDVWGMPITQGPSAERYGFAQREHDTESGLVHMRARQYDPRIGRFTQTDPIRMNRAGEHFAYAMNNPVSMVDRSGRAPGDWWDPRTYSLSDLKQGFTESVTAFGRGVVKGAVGLVEGVRDISVGTYHGVKQLVEDPASHWEDLKLVAKTMPSAVVESAKETVREIQKDPTKISELAGSATFDFLSGLAGDKGLSKLAKTLKVTKFADNLDDISRLTGALDNVPGAATNLEKGRVVLRMGSGEVDPKLDFLEILGGEHSTPSSRAVARRIEGGEIRIFDDSPYDFAYNEGSTIHIRPGQSPTQQALEALHEGVHILDPRRRGNPNLLSRELRAHAATANLEHNLGLVTENEWMARQARGVRGLADSILETYERWGIDVDIDLNLLPGP
jgi:RHS repeat-associated protein